MLSILAIERYLILTSNTVIMSSKSLIFIVLIVIVVILSLQNTQSVTVNILFWDVSYPLIVLFYIMLGVGFLIGSFGGRMNRAFKRRDISTDDKDKP
jgi:uncharacterized integral membrane protein